jgi:hypothetical protein
LKIVYHGPKAMEELAQYDPNLVVGILGGSAGTTYDAFRLIHDAQKYGARVALFGRKINNAEHQLAFIEMLRLITDGKLNPEEAVRAYHGVLQGKGIKPHRALEEDLKLTDQVMSYDGGAARRASVEVKRNPLAVAAAPNSGRLHISPAQAERWFTGFCRHEFRTAQVIRCLAFDAEVRLKVSEFWPVTACLPPQASTPVCFPPCQIISLSANCGDNV